MKKIILTLILFNVSFCFSFSQTRVGWWKFDDANNLTKAEVGNPLTIVGTGVQTTDGLDASNGAVLVKKGSYLVVDHGIAVQDNQKNVNKYSIVIDFKIPMSGTWYTFIQTDTTNVSDGDCFINTSNHIGTNTTGYSDLAVPLNTWSRLVISVDLPTTFNYYLNGNLIKVAVPQFKNDRFSLEKKLLLFADNDGDDGDIDVAEVSLYDGALNDAQVAALGGAGHTSTGISNIQANNESNVKIMSPIRDFISISVPDSRTIQNVILYDAYGRIALQSMSSDTRIDATGLNKGLYIVKIKIEGKDYSLKCIKE